MLQVERGAELQDSLFGLGVEFPCGGRGRCKGCKIKVLAGSLTIHEEDQVRLSEAELAEGWRLACCARAEGDLKIELAQWEAAILSDDTTFAFEPRPGLGVAIDLGTTTIVAQLLDLESGQVLAVRTALNAQAQHGADIMSRVEYAVVDRGQRALEQLIRTQIGRMVSELVACRGPHPGPVWLESIVLVGNTVMHHLFSGLGLEPLAQYPFQTDTPGLQVFAAKSLGWSLAGDPKVYFLPCLGGFVGSDILAGVLATRLHQRQSLGLLIDLGTNGEIILGNRERLLCAATAAGPAFEGARISMGMRAAAGAIAQVKIADGRFTCQVLGNTQPRGICGSGLVDAAAVGLDLGTILPNGRLAQGQSLHLLDSVSLHQQDIRELQLAKGAIAAGVRLLLEHWDMRPDQVAEVYLAGAFGNYINQANARRIGLLHFPPDRIVTAGNTALLGAKMALFGLAHEDISYPLIRQRTSHLSLNEAPGFQEAYVEEMRFPGGPEAGPGA